MPYDPFPFCGITQSVEEATQALVSYYSLSLAASVLWIFYAVVVRRRGHRLSGRVSPSRLVWFLPVLIAGIQSLFHADEARIGHYYGNAAYIIVFIWQEAASAAIALSLVLASSVVAEIVSGRLQDTQARWSIPSPILAAVLAVSLYWAFSLFVYTAYLIPP